MNKRVTVVAYLTLWAAIAAGIIYGTVRAGYSLWLAVVAVCFLFMILNGSLAYMVRARQLRLEGREPPPYLRYLFFPKGVPKPKDEVPKPVRVIVGVVAALAGVLFMACGGALFYQVDFSRVPNPIVAAMICVVLAGIGVALFYVGIRLIALGNRSPDAA